MHTGGHTGHRRHEVGQDQEQLSHGDVARGRYLGLCLVTVGGGRLRRLRRLRRLARLAGVAVILVSIFMSWLLGVMLIVAEANTVIILTTKTPIKIAMMVP